MPATPSTLSGAPGFAVAAPAELATPWLLVAGGFHPNGGMDRANLALAQYLADQGRSVHLVCHSADAQCAGRPNVTVHIAPRPAGSFFLGMPLLDFWGRKVARQLVGQWPDTKVVVNGDNCLWPGVNWVHYVHNVWTPPDSEGPLGFRIKQRLGMRYSRRRERESAHLARVLITNSDRTSQDLVRYAGADPGKVRTVYLGAESEWGPVTALERRTGRELFKLPADAPVAVFIGSLGFDHRKGFDVLLEAWKILSADPEWGAYLLVAGAGNAVPMWRGRIAQYGLQERVRLLGFTEQVPALLAAADLLVSPVRYEAYGLNVQEAICRGVPAMVSAGAGVAEKYASEFSELLLPDPADVRDLVARLGRWVPKRTEWTARFQPFGEVLRSYSWKDMAREIVQITESVYAGSYSACSRGIEPACSKGSVAK